MADEARRTITRTVDVAAPAQQAFALVSDLPRMGELSPENTGGSWVGGATGPAVGARFRGSNRRGRRRWSTAVVVTECAPPEQFAFEVRSLGLPVARWSYDVAPRPGGCCVTESWQDRRGAAMRAIGLLATGVGDRQAHTERSIEQTLAALKARAESTPS